jgi:DNA-binding HxlR family transcriptional regulator
MIEGLNKSFENRLRLAVMGLLMVNDVLSFNNLKEEIGATDGNLSSHLSALDKKGYIQVTKEFLNNKPHTTYKISKEGEMAFNTHLKALEKLINMGK